MLGVEPLNICDGITKLKKRTLTQRRAPPRRAADLVHVAPTGAGAPVNTKPS